MNCFQQERKTLALLDPSFQGVLLLSVFFLSFLSLLRAVLFVCDIAVDVVGAN